MMWRTPPGIANITVVSWDEMDVKVKNRLACRGATVDTYIVSIGLVILLNGGLGLINGVEEGTCSSDVASNHVGMCRRGIRSAWRATQDKRPTNQTPDPAQKYASY